MSIVRIPVSGSDRPALVDRCNAVLAQRYSWSLDGDGHVHAYIGRRNGVNEYEYLHRLVTGALPGTTIDHEDRDPLNNLWANLREATKGQQMFNVGLTVRNRTGFKGIVQRRNRWLAYIGFEHRKIYIGSYATPEAAAEAYDDAARRLHQEFACTNRSLGLV